MKKSRLSLFLFLFLASASAVAATTASEPAPTMGPVHLVVPSHALDVCVLDEFYKALQMPAFLAPYPSLTWQRSEELPQIVSAMICGMEVSVEGLFCFYLSMTSLDAAGWKTSAAGVSADLILPEAQVYGPIMSLKLGSISLEPCRDQLLAHKNPPGPVQ